MRSPSPWTARGSGALAAVLLGGALLSTPPSHAQTDGAWLTVGLPLARDGHSAVYDAPRDSMIVFGGMTNVRRNDVWVLPLASAAGWHQMLVEGTPPAGRFGHTAIYDLPRDRMIVARGATIGGTSFDDVWEPTLSGTPAWSPIAATGSPPAAGSG